MGKISVSSLAEVMTRATLFSRSTPWTPALSTTAKGVLSALKAVRCAVRRDDVQPLGEKQVDLMDVLLERGVAGGIVLDVVGGAQTFSGVQDDVGGLEVGLAVRGLVELAASAELRCGRVGERAVAFGGGLEIEAAHGPYAQHAEDEEDAGDGAEERQKIKDPPQPLPALSLWVVEDLL